MTRPEINIFVFRFKNEEVQLFCSVQANKENVVAVLFLIEKIMNGNPSLWARFAVMSLLLLTGGFEAINATKELLTKLDLCFLKISTEL